MAGGGGRGGWGGASEFRSGTTSTVKIRLLYVSYLIFKYKWDSAVKESRDSEPRRGRVRRREREVGEYKKNAPRGQMSSSSSFFFLPRRGQDNQPESEAGRSGPEYGPLESHNGSVRGRERNDKHGSWGGGTGNRNKEASSSSDSSGSSIRING